MKQMPQECQKTVKSYIETISDKALQTPINAQKMHLPD